MLGAGRTHLSNDRRFPHTQHSHTLNPRPQTTTHNSKPHRLLSREGFAADVAAGRAGLEDLRRQLLALGEQLAEVKGLPHVT